jgi:hypothetical protein
MFFLIKINLSSVPFNPGPNIGAISTQGYLMLKSNNKIGNIKEKFKGKSSPENNRITLI